MAQLVQASAQAYFSAGKEIGGKFPVRPSHLALEDRRRRLKELKAKTECRACGRRGHWACDHTCAMSPPGSSSKLQVYTVRITIQPHLPNRPKKVTSCFVPNDHGKSETYSDREVSSSTESIEQMLSTSTGCVNDVSTRFVFKAPGVHSSHNDTATSP